MKNRIALTLVLAGTIVALLGAPLFADGAETGVVSGTITDPGGAPLPGVSVLLAGDRGENNAITGADGGFRFALVQPGSYILTAELEGLGKAQSDVNVTAGKRQNLTLALQAETSETITVTSEAPMVDKFNVSAGQTLNAEVGTEITGENRTYYGVINFMPGVTNDDENADLSSSRPNINGATWADSTVYIDGVDTTFARYGGSRVFLPSSATTEVTLESGGLSADYGRTVGSATNVVVKSGTNKYHGEAVYGRTEESWNDEFDSHPEIAQRQTNPQPADFFKRTELEKEAEDNQYEIAIGGPFKRDKAWFFLSANDLNSNRTGKTINGDAVDESGVTKSRIVKLNFQPSNKQSIALSYIDTPVFRNFRLAQVFDRYTMTPHDISGELFSLSYNYSLTENLFGELKLADQTSGENKLLAFGGFDLDEAVRIKQQDPRFAGNPAFGSDFPGNNYSTYIDEGGWHNGWLLDNGFGTNEFPRKQLNLALTQFVGDNHELKYGLDAQEVEWNGDVALPNLYSGSGNNIFDSTSISGYRNDFALNPFGVACDFRNGDSCVKQDYNTPELLADLGSNDTVSQNVALYLRDRFTAGDRWTFNFGLRAENQEHTNDIGRVVMDSTDVSPRLSMAYDVTGDGKQLITAFVGRSFNQLPQQAINEYLQDQFNGYNGYERTLYLDCAFVECTPFPGFHFPLPLGYSLSLGTIVPGAHWDLVDAGVYQSDLEAYHKDEAILGWEWQFSRNWAFDAKGIYWKVDNLIGSTTQLAEINGRVNVFTLTANHDDYPTILNAIRDAASPAAQTRLATPEAIAQYQQPERSYKALQMQLNRRFAEGWGWFNNVTFSRAEGSSFGSVFNNTNDTYGENIEQVLTTGDVDNCQAAQANRTVPVDCHAALDRFVGTPLSIINREGRADFDREVIFKSSGWKIFNFTDKQHLTLGGHFTYQSGKPWARTESAGGSVTGDIPIGLSVGVPLEAPGSRELSSHWWMNLSGAYGFPLSRNRVLGELRVEIQNVTNNQDQVGVTSRGEARALRRGFQRPRRFRVLASIKF